jgi:hypothetical protein
MTGGGVLPVTSAFPTDCIGWLLFIRLNKLLLMYGCDAQIFGTLHKPSAQTSSTSGSKPAVREHIAACDGIIAFGYSALHGLAVYL